jgi:RHH-type transcriptional regulator, proline utilization regulon repressor / proline dehydrogenase / delta 1-pyrroline-5-carboxylate dehydrogenase
MRNEDFKVRLFRFVDVLPYLANDASLIRHLREYFEADKKRTAALFGLDDAGPGQPEAVRDSTGPWLRQFVIGEKVAEALETVREMRQLGLGFTIDILGEVAVSEKEACRFSRITLPFLQP